MEYNRELLKICDDNPQIYARVWAENPQINLKTKLTRVNGRQVMVARLSNTQTEWIKNRWYNKAGFQARAWRALGELTGKTTLYRKGQVLDYPREASPIETEILNLERRGYRDNFGEWSIACAYHAATDTLYLLAGYGNG